jgi:periplasmic protein TonB
MALSQSTLNAGDAFMGLSWPSLPFRTALGLSLSAHMLVLCAGLGLWASQNRVVKGAPIQIILVNTQSVKDSNERAQALAQTTLQGGGDLLSKSLASSPSERVAQMQMGMDHAPNQEQIKRLEQEERALITSLHNQLERAPHFWERAPDKAQEEKRQALLKWLGQIEERIQEQNARPKRRFLSPSTKEVNYAKYYVGVKSKIEATGTRFFPQASGHKLYGTLTMMMSINALGEVVQSEVLQSSGSQELDRRALAIVRRGAPYGEFPLEVHREADELAIVSVFHFTPDGLLSKEFVDE